MSASHKKKKPAPGKGRAQPCTDGARRERQGRPGGKTWLAQIATGDRLAVRQTGKGDVTQGLRPPRRELHIRTLTGGLVRPPALTSNPDGDAPRHCERR